MEDMRVETGEDKVLLTVLIDWHIHEMLLLHLPPGNSDTPWAAVLKNLFTKENHQTLEEVSREIGECQSLEIFKT